MDELSEGNLASDGAGILTGVGLLFAAFYIIPGARATPPLFRATAAILLSLINVSAWRRELPGPLASPRQVTRAVALITGFIIVNVVVDALVGWAFTQGNTSIVAAFLFHSGIGGHIDCLFILGAIFVGTPWLVRWMFLYYGWGREL
jgi:hypothetical protein